MLLPNLGMVFSSTSKGKRRRRRVKGFWGCFVGVGEPPRREEVLFLLSIFHHPVGSWIILAGSWICAYDACYDFWHDLVIPSRQAYANFTSSPAQCHLLTSHLIFHTPSLPDIEHVHSLLPTSDPQSETHLHRTLPTHPRTTPRQPSSLALQSHNRIHMSHTAFALTTITIIQSFTSLSEFFPVSPHVSRS